MKEPRAFYSWYEGRDVETEKADRQEWAAKGTPIKWTAPTEGAMAAFKILVRGSSINVVYIPPPPRS